jgi:hypothetical protein
MEVAPLHKGVDSNLRLWVLSRVSFKLITVLSYASCPETERGRNISHPPLERNLKSDGLSNANRLSSKCPLSWVNTTDDKVNRMSKLAQARAQACLLLEQVLATAKK